MKIKNLIKLTRTKAIIILVMLATIIITLIISVNNMKGNKSNKQTELNAKSSDNTYTEKRISLFDVRRYTYIDYVTDVITKEGYDKTSNAYGRFVVEYITISRIRPEKNKEKYPELLYVYEIMYPYNNHQKTTPRYAYVSLDDLLLDISWAGAEYSYLHSPNTYKDWKEYDRKDDTNTNSDNKKDDDTTNNDNKEYYTPIEVYNNQGVNGIYKDNTETKKYVIQDGKVEYWEEEYIYVGVYKQEGNKISIEYSSRYKYDNSEDKYLLAGWGYTTMFKLGKDCEELNIKIGSQLVTSNEITFSKEKEENVTGIEQAINDEMINDYISVGVTEKELRSAYYDGNLQFYYDSWEECLKDAKKLKILRTNEEI